MADVKVVVGGGDSMGSGRHRPEPRHAHCPRTHPRHAPCPRPLPPSQVMFITADKDAYQLQPENAVKVGGWVGGGWGGVGTVAGGQARSAGGPVWAQPSCARCGMFHHAGRRAFRPPP